MPAAAAGFKAGDVITSIDGRTIEGFEDMQRIVGVNGERELRFGIERGGELSIEATPEVKEQDDTFGSKFKRGLIGIAPSNTPATRTPSAGPIEAVRLGVRETYIIIAHTLQGIADIVTAAGGRSDGRPHPHRRGIGQGGRGRASSRCCAGSPSSR